MKKGTKIAGILSSESINEADALDALSKFGVTQAGLRKTAQAKGQIVIADKAFLYSRPWVDDLARNWMMKKDACKSLGITDKQYWHWCQKHEPETIVIGMISIFRSGDVVGK